MSSKPCLLAGAVLIFCAACDNEAPSYRGINSQILAVNSIQERSGHPGYMVKCTVTNTLNIPIYFASYESGRPLLLPYVNTGEEWRVDGGVCGVGLKTWKLPPGRAVDREAYTPSLDDRKIGFVYRLEPEARETTTELATLADEHGLHSQ
jgi:hypothetical protein